MSLKPQAIGPIPEETVRVARAAFPKGNVYIRMRDEFGSIYQDEQFVALFPRRGQPAEAPWRLALTTVMQFAEGLSDRQAAAAVQSRIDWKYALGLELTDPGFDYSILCQFRDRLLAGSAEEQLLDVMLACFKERGLLKARTRQRTDSTHILAAIRILNRLECVGETLRATLNSLAVVAPNWLRAQVTPEWFDRYSTRLEESRLPKGEEARYALGETIGTDGFHLLQAIYARSTPVWLREVPAVEILRRVWLHQFYVVDDQVRWRRADNLSPAGLRINSPYDPEASYANKRSTTWIGYKVHLTETCEADAPHLITQVTTTAAVASDVEMTAPIQADLAARDLLPNHHLLDSGYVDAQLLVTSQVEHGVEIIGPVRPDVSWQAQTNQGFDVSHFAIDWQAQQATCPHGKTSTQWKPLQDPWGNDVIHIEFARKDCRQCVVRACYTRAKSEPRELTVRPQAQHEALQAARQRQRTSSYKKEYALRAGVEGTMSQGVRAFGLRRCRYTGLSKTHLQHITTAVAMNLVRVAAWLSDIPHAKTRTSRFAALAT